MVKIGRCEWCREDPLYLRYHDLEWWRADTRSISALRVAGAPDDAGRQQQGGAVGFSAFMQAAGMVNDHLTSCFRHAQCSESRAKRYLVA